MKKCYTISSPGKENTMFGVKGVLIVMIDGSEFQFLKSNGLKDYSYKTQFTTVREEGATYTFISKNMKYIKVLHTIPDDEDEGLELTDGNPFESFVGSSKDIFDNPVKGSKKAAPKSKKSKAAKAKMGEPYTTNTCGNISLDGYHCELPKGHKTKHIAISVSKEWGDDEEACVIPETTSKPTISPKPMKNKPLKIKELPKTTEEMLSIAKNVIDKAKSKHAILPIDGKEN